MKSHIFYSDGKSARYCIFFHLKDSFLAQKWFSLTFFLPVPEKCDVKSVKGQGSTTTLSMWTV